MIELYTDKEIAESRQKYIDYLEGKSNVLFDFSLVTYNGFVLHFGNTGITVNNEGYFTTPGPAGWDSARALLKKYCSVNNCEYLLNDSPFLCIGTNEKTRKYLYGLIFSRESYIYDLTDSFNQYIYLSYEDSKFIDYIQKLRKEKLNA